jgi:hypothetical protein
MGTAVQVTFPFVADHEPVDATVIGWRPSGTAPFDLHDVAVLRLAGSLPDGVVPIAVGTSGWVG